LRAHPLRFERGRGRGSEGSRRSVLAYEGRGDRLPEDDSAGSYSDERGGLEDELRMQRSEEELGTGVRKRKAGSMNVRKSVRTEREQVRVPRRREEVDVERVPVGREVAEAEIGEDEEFVVQVFEEEVVVSKRVVLKEEIRLRKRVVEEVEVVEVDLRKEEVEIDDRTEYGGRRGDRQEPLPPERG
jgi:uncharacterized protein (TIGR02271 family)